MNILFVHQDFPGQYAHIIRQISNIPSIKAVGLGINRPSFTLPEDFSYFRYAIQRSNTPGIHPWALETESKIIRGEFCARAAHELQKQGFIPDLICVHPGWGEALFLKEIWPHSPILNYEEFYYQTRGFDSDFDPETQPCEGWEAKARTTMKNSSVLISLESSDWSICPTKFQRSTYPEHWQQFISVIHDGIDTQKARPNSKIQSLKLPNKAVLKRNEPIITFVNRTLEPYRGCHTMIRAIPSIQKLCPSAKIVIVGATKGVSYGAACPNGEWKDQYLREIEGQYDPKKIHFTGSLAYDQFLRLLQISSAHVYLTYPFVLSWSLLEAMSTECAIVGSATAPVEELINHGENGMLVDFFDHEALAESVAELLNNRELAETLGKNARKTILKDYSLEQCVPRHLALMNMVACGALSRR